MLTTEESARFTQVGPGTPMGELLRRYWMPVGTRTEIEQEPVQRVRLLGEDLVLFKSERGELGLIGHRCPHRGIGLEYGIPQDNGLRCAYHGWAIDTEGHVVDMPFEPACLPLQIPSYPVEELGGLIWAYLGPTPAPLLPRWDFLVRADLNKTLRITPLPCNWLQCMDNSLDPIHFEHLHGHYGNYMMKKLGRPPMINPRPHKRIEFDVFEYGIYKRRLVEGASEADTDWTIGHPILFPYILAQGGPDQVSCQLRVPADDTNTTHYVILGQRPDPGEAPSPNMPVRRGPLELDPYGRVFAPTIVPQDEAAWVGQGPVTDRTAEHLTTSDKGILLYRKLLLENMEAVARGDDPMGVIRDRGRNEPMISLARGSVYGAFREGVREENYGGVRESYVAVPA